MSAAPITRVTPEELAERGWEGASRCRCLVDGEGYVPCPPQICDAEGILEEYRYLSHSHGIAIGLLTDEQLAEYRRRRDVSRF